MVCEPPCGLLTLLSPVPLVKFPVFKSQSNTSGPTFPFGMNFPKSRTITRSQLPKSGSRGLGTYSQCHLVVKLDIWYRISALDLLKGMFYLYQGASTMDSVQWNRIVFRDDRNPSLTSGDRNPKIRILCQPTILFILWLAEFYFRSVLHPIFQDDGM